MLLVLEIILTAWACVRLSQAKKNWAWGLVPILSGIVIGFILALSGTGIILVFSNYAILLDLTIVVILVVIANKYPPVI